jgi:hypothetical protein
VIGAVPTTSRLARARGPVRSTTSRSATSLAEWLASSSSRQRYESEGLLKVLFAENGTKDDLLATIRGIRDDARAVLDHFLRFADVYEAGEGQYPDRFDLSALSARLLSEQQMVTVRWADWAERVVSGWDGPSGAGCGLGSRHAPRIGQGGVSPGERDAPAWA